MDDPLYSSARSLLDAARQEEWLTVKEFAALRRVHEQTIYSMLRYRPEKFPHAFERVGRQIRIYVPRASIKGLTTA